MAQGIEGSVKKAFAENLKKKAGKKEMAEANKILRKSRLKKVAGAALLAAPIAAGVATKLNPLVDKVSKRRAWDKYETGYIKPEED